MLFKRNYNELGKTYAAGEVIFRQGDPGDALYVILEGQVALVTGKMPHLPLDVLGKDEMFGAISLFDGLPRPVCARALSGGARVLTIDRKGFMQRVENDPSLALRILENMAKRSRHYLAELVRLKESTAEPTVPEGPGKEGTGGA